MREIIYEDYLKIATTDVLSEDAQIVLALLNRSKIDLAWMCASRIIAKVVDHNGNVKRKLTQVEKQILLMHPACLHNMDGSLQYNGVIFE